MGKQAIAEDVQFPAIPDPVSLFLKMGLYEHYQLEPSSISAVENYRGTVDMYCVECGAMSVFADKDHNKLPALNINGHAVGKGTRIPSINAAELSRQNALRIALSPRTFRVELECSRNANHKAVYFFRVGENSFLKIGQYPSRADIELPELAKYRGILGPKYVEFTRSVGLASHGIGVGSFVYLRRIFEGLIETAHAQATKDPNWNEALYKGGMDEKIRILKDKLPPHLVETRSIYSILSKGLHELTEEECLEYFEPLKVGIELILDEQIEHQIRERKIAQSKQAISSIAGKLK